MPLWLLVGDDCLTDARDPSSVGVGEGVHERTSLQIVRFVYLFLSILIDNNMFN